MILTPEKLIWVKAPFSKERGAFSLASAQLGVHVDHLEHQYDDASLRPLTDMIWRRLENTKSWTVRRPNDTKLDLSSMIDTFNGGRIPAPVVIEYVRDRYWMVAGEQQLQVSRVSGITPKVVFVRTNYR
jgi:hypothetical protein